MDKTWFASIKALVFDMDGTLIDTESLYKQTWKLSARHFDFEITDAEYTRFIGVPFEYCLQRVRDLLPSHVSLHAFEKRLVLEQEALKRAQAVCLKRGAKEILQALAASKSNVLKIGLVTSSTQASVDEYFHGSAQNIFDAIVHFHSVEHHKPHPAPYQKVCRDLQVRPDEVVVVEDSMVGLTSAQRAGCRVVVVPDMTPITAEGAQSVVGVYRDLYQVLDEIVQPLLACSQAARSC